ncbi:MAG: glucokinase [Gammaproteobacteria bacterium]|nr:glucokinase [Gammaproteobacteria bacterium]
MSDRYLVGDIGATNARFALGSATGVGTTTTLATGEFGSATELIDAACHRLGIERFDEVCLAIAGRVSGGVAEITNGSLHFAEAEIAKHLDCDVRIVNDFFALAHAVPIATALAEIGGRPSADGVKALLGPGSGLGMSVLVPQDHGWLVVPSEGGHADLAPGSPLEREILGVLQQQHGHVCWETVLSGPGLVNLYQAVATVWGGSWDGSDEPLTAEQITGRGVTVEDPVCHQTLEIFFGLLGSAAGNLAVTVCATGGVYIGGGIVPGLSEFAKQSALRRRFEERGALTEMVRSIPLYVILDEAPGLLGALQYLMHGR